MRKCTICNKLKEISQYYKNCRSRDGYMKHCSLCHKEMSRDWLNRNVERRRIRNRINTANYRIKNKEKCKEINKKCREKNGSKYLENRRIVEKNKRIKIFDYYGGKCECCGESNYHFLSIDHKDSNGSVHRKQKRINIHDEIIRNNFPRDYQILCFNCNFAREFYGGKYKICPHKSNSNFKDAKCFKLGLTRKFAD
jgi:hypothetical protein